MTDPVTLALVVGSLLGVSAAHAQTSLDAGSGDQPTGYSFVEGSERRDLSEEQSRNESTASHQNRTSPFVVQLSFVHDRSAAEAFGAEVQQTYPTLFTDKTLNIEPGSDGFKVVVASFGDKALADQWCHDYKTQSLQDCLVLSRVKTDQRVRELADAIRAGMQSLSDDSGDGQQKSRIEQPERLMAHQFQRAWEKAKPTAGVFEAPYCANCTYKMQVRELMVSNFELPRGEVITGFDIGDPTIFSAQTRGQNRLAIMARSFGADTNIQVYSESGRVYPVYVRALDVQSDLLPDLVFRVLDPTLSYTGVTKPNTLSGAATLTNAPDHLNTSRPLVNFRPQGVSEDDFLKEIPFDPGKLRFDGFKVWGSADKKLMPSRVFRDDKHLYIQFDDVTRLPGFTAYSVFDGLDERIGTRVSGNTFIVKGLADKISLKSGKSYLCIELARNV